MARRGSADVSFFLVGGYDILGTLTKIDDTVEAITERSDTLGDAWVENSFVGVRNGEIAQEGFFDDAAGSVHDLLTSGVGISRVLSYGFTGTATGAYFQGWEGAMQVNYERQIVREALTKARATYRTNGTIETGRVVRMYGAAGTTGASTGTPLDNAVSATGGAGYLQYNATAGESNIRLLHSSDNVTYATILTFTKTTSGFGAERVITTAVIERYTAADVTTATATGSIGALNFFVGLSRGAQTS